MFRTNLVCHFEPWRLNLVSLFAGMDIFHPVAIISVNTIGKKYPETTHRRVLTNVFAPSKQCRSASGLAIRFFARVMSSFAPHGDVNLPAPMPEWRHGQWVGNFTHRNLAQRNSALPTFFQRFCIVPPLTALPLSACVALHNVLYNSGVSSLHSSHSDAVHTRG